MTGFEFLGIEMLSLENFKNARWQDVYTFFVAGDPPLIVVLLIINTIFLVLFVYKNARDKGRSHTTSYKVQALLIIANGLIMFQPQLLPKGKFLDNINHSKNVAQKIFEGFTG